MAYLVDGHVLNAADPHQRIPEIDALVRLRQGWDRQLNRFHSIPSYLHLNPAYLLRVNASTFRAATLARRLLNVCNNNDSVRKGMGS
jgi:hypothetical protein